MVEKKTLNTVAEIIGGQIMSRVVAKKENEDKIIETRKIVIPKAILDDGTIDITEMPEENLKEKADDKRITKIGDIVIKLSTPYDSAIITEESAGCLVPSFCAIIRACDINTEYLQAYLSTDICKNEFKNQVFGSVMSILSVGKIGKIEVPYLNKNKQLEIGKSYRETQNKIAVLKRIVDLEAKKNNIVFKELCK